MKNEYEIIGDKVHIKLNRGLTTIIDLDDFDKVNQLQGTWVATYRKNTKSYYVFGYHLKHVSKFGMSRWIMNVIDKNLYVDHINQDTLNNTKENLRICTPQQNNMNRRPFKKCSSKYKGVCMRNETRGRIAYEVSIYKEKYLYIGLFQNEVDAALAYDEKAIELFGEFAYLNFPTQTDLEIALLKYFNYQLAS